MMPSCVTALHYSTAIYCSSKYVKLPVQCHCGWRVDKRCSFIVVSQSCNHTFLHVCELNDELDKRCSFIVVSQSCNHTFLHVCELNGSVTFVCILGLLEIKRFKHLINLISWLQLNCNVLQNRLCRTLNMRMHRFGCTSHIWKASAS